MHVNGSAGVHSCNHLGCDSVRASWEKFGNASSLEAMLGQAHGSTKTCSTSTHNNRVVGVVDNWVFRGQVLRYITHHSRELRCFSVTLVEENCAMDKPLRPGLRVRGTPA